MHRPRKQIPLHSLSLSLTDVIQIFERLLRHVHEQADLELSRLVKPKDQSDESFQAEKADIRTKVFCITVTISGDDGASLFGDDSAIFRSPNIPNNITSIYMTNVTAYQNITGNRPANAFELLLDFSKPPLLDSNNFVSSPTANNSNLTAEGDRESWVAAVIDAVMGIIQYRRTRRSWIHRAFIYDFGLLAITLPIGLYLCWKMSPLITAQLGTVHTFLSATAYVYLIVLVIWAYRIFFGYTKWAFPTMELRDNKDNAGKHRAFWWIIIVGLFTNLVWEVVKGPWSSIQAQ